MIGTIISYISSSIPLSVPLMYGSTGEIITEKPCTVNVDGELYKDVPFKVDIVSDTLKMYR